MIDKNVLRDLLSVCLKNKDREGVRTLLELYPPSPPKTVAEMRANRIQMIDNIAAYHEMIKEDDHL